ncbi:MAG: hypothetical protein Q7J03_01585 [Methanoregula sp.]|nr:hypothetical protein [Methanoregula sp.]
MVNLFGIDLNFIEILKLIAELVLVPIIVIYLYDFVNFFKCFNNLCDEINENYSKIQETAINEQLDRMQKIWSTRIENSYHPEWVGFAKRISLWILSEKNDIAGTDYYRYLSNNELKNFIRQGYYRFIQEREENLTLFYVYCENLSISEQNIEKIINQKMSLTGYSSEPYSSKRQFLDDNLKKIQYISNSYRPVISEKYEIIHPFFKRRIFHVIRLYLSENLFIKKGKELLMRFCNISTIPKWVIINFVAIIIFAIAFWLGTQWIHSDSILSQWSIIIILASFFGIVISISILPLTLMHWRGNQNQRNSVQLVVYIIFSFILLVAFFGIIEIYFPEAPNYMVAGATAFISAIVGGLVVEAIKQQ